MDNSHGSPSPVIIDSPLHQQQPSPDVCSYDQFGYDGDVQKHKTVYIEPHIVEDRPLDQSCRCGNPRGGRIPTANAARPCPGLFPHHRKMRVTTKAGASHARTQLQAGEAAQAAARISKLSLRPNDGARTSPPGTPSRRKRSATSEIQVPPALARDHAPFGAKPAPTSFAKRLACGKATPFPDAVRSHIVSNDLSLKNVPSKSISQAIQGQVAAPGAEHKQIDVLSAEARTSKALKNNSREISHPGSNPGASITSRYPGILPPPESRRITCEQLVIEVKSLYRGLVMVEAECVKLDDAELASDQRCINPEDRDKWQKMIAIHRALLYEHHDFLSASQHPAANEALRKLPLKYSMPARMWKHAIHSFLEVLRRRLPGSMDYIIQFIYMAYQMIALLYETVEAFKPTWIECLGDLARYRMAIEDGVQRDRETWGVVARSWYFAASDLNPETGRLYHHLGILARPDGVQQLYFYCRSLTCIQPFPNARESLSTLLAPALESYHAGGTSSSLKSLDSCFLYLHAAMFMNLMKPEMSDSGEPEFGTVHGAYVLGLEQTNMDEGWKNHGVFVAIANIAACFDYGFEEAVNPLSLAFNEKLEGSHKLALASRDGTALQKILRPMRLLFTVMVVNLGHKADHKVLPHVHVLLVFLRSLTALAVKAKTIARTILEHVPWRELVAFLNSFAKLELSYQSISNCKSPETLAFEADTPLPEDYSLRGEPWARDYFPESWFLDAPSEDTRYLEQSSTERSRIQRVLGLGEAIAKQVDFFSFDHESRNFRLSDKVGLCEATKSLKKMKLDEQKYLPELWRPDRQVPAIKEEKRCSQEALRRSHFGGNHENISSKDRLAVKLGIV